MSNEYYKYDEWVEIVIKEDINTCDKYDKYIRNDNKMHEDPEEYYGKAALPILIWHVFHSNNLDSHRDNYVDSLIK